MKSILSEIKKGKVLVSDGAWGTMLIEKGLKTGECPELWNLTRRNDVLSIAKSYINTGADIILTNSFGGSPYKLAHYNLSDKAFEINYEAAKISREAAGSDKFVLGSIGPTGAILIMGEVSEKEIYDGFSIQAEALMNGGVDAICVETMSAIDEALLAIKAAKEITDLEIICTFTFEKTMQNEYRTMMGVSPSEMVEAVKNAGASIIGTNCGNGFDGMIEIVKEIREVDQSTPILVHANAGKPIFKNGKTIFPETPIMMSEKIPKLINCGANIIGGCCGTTPDHIKLIAEKIKTNK